MTVIIAAFRYQGNIFFQLQSLSTLLRQAQDKLPFLNPLALSDCAAIVSKGHGECFSLCEKCIDPYNFSLSPNQRSKITAAADRTDKWLYEVIPFTGKSR